MKRIKLLKPLSTSTTTQIILDGSVVGFQQPWSMLSPGHSRLPLFDRESLGGSEQILLYLVTLRTYANC